MSMSCLSACKHHLNVNYFNEMQQCNNNVYCQQITPSLKEKFYVVGLVAIRSPLINDIECCMIKREYKCDEIEVRLVFYLVTPNVTMF